VHQGITYFAVDIHQPGVEVRPLREMTGRALFNEVFLTDEVVDDDAAIGGVNNGWAVANTTLGFERSGLGAGGDQRRADWSGRGRSPATWTGGQGTSPVSAVAATVVR
jgi:alkylation response protein AidB-like acyl-CoA dehydrogenase